MRSRPEAPPAAVASAPTAARSEIDSLRAGMVNATSQAPLLPCDPSMADARSCGRVRVLLGPFIVTNLYSSGGCQEELFVMSADAKPQWTMLVVPGDRLNVSGRFPIEDGQTLYIGLRGNGSAKPDARCGVVWSGYRPAEKPPTYGTIGD